jgi:hypothetical protein
MNLYQICLAYCSLKTNNYAVLGAIDMISDTRDTLPPSQL